MLKSTRQLIRYIRKLQGTAQYKHRDKLGRQNRQAEILKAQGFIIK